MTDSIHTDFTCSSCNTIATSLTECDHCRKWLCQSCSKLPKSTLNKMTALKNVVSTGFVPTVDMILDRPNVRYSPIAPSKPLPRAPLPHITIIPLQLHPIYLHNPLILHLYGSPHHPTLNPKLYQSPYPSHPTTHPLFLPSLLSPLAYPMLPLNDYNPSLP